MCCGVAICYKVLWDHIGRMGGDICATIIKLSVLMKHAWKLAGSVKWGSEWKSKEAVRKQ